MLDELLHLLNSSTVVHNPQIVELIAYGQDAFRVKIRNAPHHPEQATNFPHHFHDEQGRLVHSPLSGNPLADLALVLRQIEDYVRESGQAWWRRLRILHRPHVQPQLKRSHHTMPNPRLDHCGDQVGGPVGVANHGWAG